MKTLKEMYTIVLDEMENWELKDRWSMGICVSIVITYRSGKITYPERLILEADFMRRYPTIFSKFWWNKYFISFSKSGFWWTLGKEGYQQRIKFLKSIIKKLK